MKLLYATSLIFPSGLANRVQILAMAKEFGKNLQKNFVLGVSRTDEESKETQVKSFGTVTSYILAFKYLRFAKKEGITHIYCREPRLLFFLLFYNFVFFHNSIYFTYEIHAYPSTSLNKMIEFLLVKRVPCLVFITHHLKDIYQKKFHLQDKNLFVAPDGVNMEIFDISLSKEEARKILDLSQDKFIVGYCGRFETLGMDKGLSFMLKTFGNLPNSFLFVAMGGKPRHVRQYQELARDLGVSEKVRIDGHFSQEIVAQYQKAADVLIMPFPFNDHYAYYMSPLKMFEYMASQRLIITTDLPSIREVLDESMAIFIPPNDIQALRKVLQDMLNNFQKQDSLAENAYKEVQKYTWAKRVENILKFLK